ncbi:MAG: DNA translocase FtsK [Acetobacter sp.]|nr:DNA translocase FtsK [Acetobacter sp.]
MWVDFIHALIDQEFAYPPDKRIKNALPALQIPKDGIEGIPSFKPENTESYTTKNTIEIFTKAFKHARHKVGVYVTLITPKGEPIHRETVQDNINNIFNELGDQDEQEIRDALEATKTLLDDSDAITPRKWRPSQEMFCQKVSWTRLGKKIFENTRKDKKEKLGERTLRFIEGNYSNDITDEERGLLTTLKEIKPSEPCPAEIAFFNRWQERLSTDMKLSKAWQKRIFSKEVIGHDLLSALAEGFEALLDASDTLDKMEKPRILVRATKHNKAKFWQELDKAIYQRFCFELNSMKSLFKSYVIWDLQAAENHQAQNSSTSAEKRKIDLELFLVEEEDLRDLENLRDPPKNAPRVKVIWQPGKNSPKDEPITLALIDDIHALAKAAQDNHSLFHSLTFMPTLNGKDKNFNLVELSNRYSFNDVTQGQQGRTFTLGPEKDLVHDFQTLIEKLNGICQETKKTLLDAARHFNTLYCEAIIRLSENPQEAFTSDLFDRAAQAFGDLCAAACRLNVSTWQEKREIQDYIAKIGVVTSESSTHNTEPLALLPVWHPFRLAEWRAKIKYLASFITSILNSHTTQNVDFSTAFQQYRLTQSRWFFPEVIFSHETTMVSVEDLCGYSLMVPVDSLTQNQEALNISLSSAAETLDKGIRRYLDIYPHRAINLSVTLFDLESEKLLSEVVRKISTSSLKDYPHLHCTLIITHHDQDRIRNIYQNQNASIETLKSESDQSSSSRLCIRVQPNNNNISETTNPIRENDIVFFHHVISHYAKPCWIEEEGEAQELSPHFDLSQTQEPRRKITEAMIPKTSLYLTLPHPPRAVAHYQNLIYECSKQSFLRPSSHAAFVQQINFEEQTLHTLIKQVHRFSEWVITYDQIVSKSLLEYCDVQIISDISAPEAEERTIISADKIHDQLTYNIKNDLIQTCNIEAKKAEELATHIIKDVVKISGQKILLAAQHTNFSREILGLTIMRHWMESMLPQNQTPIWLSLDDYRGWFMPEKGPTADAIALTVDHSRDNNQEKFRISLQIGEAKFVEKNAKDTTKKKALKQIENTLDHFIRRFIDNEDTLSRTAECKRLVDLLINQNYVIQSLGFSQRTAFFNALSKGDVSFRISGEIVLCLHDEHDRTDIEIVSDCPYLRCHTLTTPTIDQILKKHPTDYTGLDNICWYYGHNPDNSHNNNPDRSPHLDETSENVFVHTPHQNTKEQENLCPIKTPTPLSELDNTNDHKNTLPTPPLSPLVPLDVPPFFPPPVQAVLLDMAANEEGTVTDSVSLAWAEKTAQELQRALSHFGMQAEFAGEPRLTPNSAIIAFRGHASFTFKEIKKRESELLTTYGIEATALQGRSQILLVVKRAKRAKVFLASTWLQAQKNFQHFCQNKNHPEDHILSFILGPREDADDLLYLNLTSPFADYEEHAPHTLIAGETGSGKGILTQGILLQLITFNAPQDVELIVIDPKKGVDFTWLKNTPHMKKPIITEKDKAKSIFEELTHIMDNRYRQFESLNVPTLTEYNRKVPAQERLSRIFLVHDELGAWMAQEKDYQDVVLSSVANLGMKARAAGIHLVLITQRPDAETIPPRLRDNIGNRLCLKVRDNTASRIALGMGGAEKLLGKGHLACILGNQTPPDGQAFFTVQVPFIKTEDIERIAEAAKEYWTKDYCS